MGIFTGDTKIEEIHVPTSYALLIESYFHSSEHKMEASALPIVIAMVDSN